MVPTEKVREAFRKIASGEFSYKMDMLPHGSFDVRRVVNNPGLPILNSEYSNFVNEFLVKRNKLITLKDWTDCEVTHPLEWRASLETTKRLFASVRKEYLQKPLNVYKNAVSHGASITVDNISQIYAGESVGSLYWTERMFKLVYEIHLGRKGMPIVIDNPAAKPVTQSGTPELLKEKGHLYRRFNTEISVKIRKIEADTGWSHSLMAVNLGYSSKPKSLKASSRKVEEMASGTSKSGMAEKRYLKLMWLWEQLFYTENVACHPAIQAIENPVSPFVDRGAQLGELLKKIDELAELTQDIQRTLNDIKKEMRQVETSTKNRFIKILEQL